MIGSKAHKQSKVAVSLQRRVMSKTFWALRRILLHVDVGDSQGTILIERELARSGCFRNCTRARTSSQPS